MPINLASLSTRATMFRAATGRSFGCGVERQIVYGSNQHAAFATTASSRFCTT